MTTPMVYMTVRVVTLTARTLLSGPGISPGEEPQTTPSTWAQSGHFSMKLADAQSSGNTVSALIGSPHATLAVSVLMAWVGPVGNTLPPRADPPDALRFEIPGAFCSDLPRHTSTPTGWK